MASDIHFKTGQIIVSQAWRVPFLRHEGLVVVDPNNEVWVLHNKGLQHPHKERLHVFLRRNPSIKIKNSRLVGVSYYDIMETFEKQCSHRAFSLLAFNCEHFIDCMEGKSPQSQQMIHVGAGLACVALAAIFVYLKYFKK